MNKTLASLVTVKLQFEFVRSSRVKAKRPRKTYLIQIFKKRPQHLLKTDI